MTRDDFDKMGDLHKTYEARTESTLLAGCPVLVRLDGRSFHTFTKGLQRPYDARLSECMIETAKYLVGETHADIGYVQSDEISLGFRNSIDNPMMFSLRVQKISSVFAALASVKFNRLIGHLIPEKAHLLPVFDARVFQYPTLELAAQSFLWRETDATRNSLTMAAHAYYDHHELHGMGYSEKHEMLHRVGVNWNDYPAFFKRGTYVAKREVMKHLNDSELANIPEKYRPTGPVSRSVIVDLELAPYTQLLYPPSILFPEKPEKA